MDLSKLSISELRTLRTKVNQWIDHKGISNAMSFIVGQEVTVDHKKLRGQICEVVKINRTKVVVNAPSMGKVSVPMSMIEAA